MFGLTQEAFFALIVGAVMLTQYLFGRLRRKAAEMRPEVPPQSDTPSTSAPAPALPRPSEVAAIPVDVYKPVEEPSAVPLPLRPTVSRFDRPHPRRFSRQRLMPDRRAVQDAFVIAAILHPCHAHKPPDVG